MSKQTLNRRKFLALSATASAGAMAACAAPAAAPAAEVSASLARGNDLLIAAVYGDIDMWDPALLVGSKPAQTAIQNCLDQLTRYNPKEVKLDDGTTYSIFNAEDIGGMLAESWEMKGADMVFHIREGVKFPDGSLVDASVVYENYKRFFELKGVATFLLGMGGSVTDISQIEVVDPKTLVIRMTKANDLTIKNITMGNTSILNLSELKAHATDSDPWAAEYYKKNFPVGTGPYKLDTYSPGDKITLVRNDGYWGPPPKFAKVIQKIVPDAAQRVLLLKSGEVDIIDNVPFKELASLRQDPNVRILPIPTTYIFLISLNNKIAPFDKKEVRQAFSYAVPYDDIIEKVLYGYGKRARAFIPEGQNTYDPSIKGYDHNPEKAKERLAAAGYKDGVGLPPIKLSIRIGIEEDERTAIIIQGALREIGVNISIEKLNIAAYNEVYFGRKMQMGMQSWDMWVNDPYYNMFWQTTTEGSNNGADFSNERIDEIISKYTLFPNGPERDDASKEAQRILEDEAPYIILYQMVWPIAMRADVGGYTFFNDTLTRYDTMFRKL